MSQFRVLIDDNFHYMDEGHRLEFGTFDTLAEAVAACRRIVDEWLLSHHKPGMKASELFDLYVGFGEDPFVVPAVGSIATNFSAWDYAQERAHVLCGVP
jgi:hypothetical protein